MSDDPLLDRFKKRSAMALVDACRSPIRRRIMILAEEADAQQLRVTAKSLSEALDKKIATVSYHVAQLVKAGALREDGGVQKRGAWQRHLAPTEAFQATMTDTVALDRIAELVDGKPLTAARFLELKKTVRATGRPVEA